MRRIDCDECGKFLFETDKQSDGAAGAVAQSKKFVFKMPILFTDKYSALFFCDNTCSKSFFDKNIPKNEEMSKLIEDMKKQIPSMVKETCNGLQRISDIINKNLKP